MTKSARPKYSYRGTTMAITWPKCRHYKACLAEATRTTAAVNCANCKALDIPAAKPKDETA